MHRSNIIQNHPFHPKSQLGFNDTLLFSHIFVLTILFPRSPTLNPIFVFIVFLCFYFNFAFVAFKCIHKIYIFFWSPDSENTSFSVSTDILLFWVFHINGIIQMQYLMTCFSLTVIFPRFKHVVV